MDMKASLVLMAAGFGSRFGGGIKQIEPVGPNGEVLMDYAVHDALAAGFNRVIFIIRKELEQAFREGVGKRVEKKCDVEYVYQDVSDLPAGFALPEGRKKPWGTGQAVLACRNVINEPFCVLNADDYYGAEAYRQIYNYLASDRPKTDKLDLCMAGYVLGNTLSMSGAVTRGLCKVGADGKLQGLVETKGIELVNGQPCAKGAPLDAGATCSMNLWGMPAEFIGYLQDGFRPFLENLGDDVLGAEYLLPTIVGGMIEKGEGTVAVLPTNDKWFGMTYSEDKELTQKEIARLIAQGAYPEKL